MVSWEYPAFFMDPQCVSMSRAEPHFGQETSCDAVSIGSRVTGGLEES